MQVKANNLRDVYTAYSAKESEYRILLDIAIKVLA